MTRRLILILILFSAVFTSFATHLRGGEITYEHISGNTYLFRVVLCLDEDGIVVDEEIAIDFDDGKGPFQMPLINGPSVGGGGVIGSFENAIYEIEHTFSGPSTYSVVAQVVTRNANIENINGGSGTDEFTACLETVLSFSPFARNYNNSVYFENSICPEIACAGKEYCFNPLAVDPDGDSLVYSLVTPQGQEYGFGVDPDIEGCKTIQGYVFPNVIGGGNLSIDSRTGTICWDSPGKIGDFVFVVKVDEYFGGILVGSVVRDIQLTIKGACVNNPPIVDPIPDTCIIAGNSFDLDISASDPDGNSVLLTASGLPFIATNPATFPPVSGNPVTGVFSWDTTCDDIPLTPYNYVVTVSAEEIGTDPQLSAYQSFYVRVIPPDITNLTVTKTAGAVVLNWDKISCDGALGYNVYRIGGASAPTTGTCCLPGAAEDLGYALLAQIPDDDITTYSDTDIVVGGEYCYVVTAYFPGEAESCPTETQCVVIPKDDPVMTHVTVNVTGGDGVGVDSIQWSSPLESELDLITFDGPYEYRLFFDARDQFPSQEVYRTPSEVVFGDLDTTHVWITDTESITNSFRVELWETDTDTQMGVSAYATSVYLSTAPADNQITLTWEENVTWTNTDYEIYRSDNFAGPFVLIGTSTVQEYIDQNLINGKEYCYYIKSIGAYPISSVISPIENLSQIKCDIPVDLTPPCPPELIVESDCIEGVNDLTWTNPNNTCADDVTHYNIYYSATEDGEMELIAEINSGDDSNAEDTTFTFDNLFSVAGCYAVTALDSLKYNNESIMSDTVCVENCPVYDLPNVFTPNSSGDGSGINDLFHPIEPYREHYRHIDHVEFMVFNRWGQVVFETEDADLGWDGRHKDNGEMVPDGTFYYTCKVFAITLKGIEEFKNLHGHITLFNEK